MGQTVGDALGELVEFSKEAEIGQQYTRGVWDIVDGGYWNTIAVQATDGSELALSLARTLLAWKAFDVEAVAGAYGDWMRSRPLDVGTTTGVALGAAVRAARQQGRRSAGGC